MTRASREFQVFVKPAGCICNLDCHYCYYLQKEQLCPEDKSFRMPDDVLEQYIIQHIDACPESLIRFSWHGGEPTVLGLNYLCAGYKRFFTHCRPFVSQVAAQWRRQTLEQQMSPAQTSSTQTGRKPGRNDSCPCGSGLKYKKCCMGK